MLAITKATLHIIDREAGPLICSQFELDLKEYAVMQYIDSVIKRIEKAEFKKADGSTNFELSEMVLNQEVSFIEKSQQIAQYVFDGLAISEDAPSGDLLVFELQDTNANKKLGFIKFNYNPTYTRMIDNKNDGTKMNIVINKTTYPATSQKIQECLLVDLETMVIEIVEKKYTFEGNKRLFLSEHLLQIETDNTVTNNINLVKNAVKQVALKYNEEQFISASKAQQALFMSVEDEGYVDSDKVADYVFGSNHSAKEEFREFLEKSKFKGEIPKNVQSYETKLKNHKFKMSHDIELKIPATVYENKDVFEFLNNPDGTISIMLKNMSFIESKF